MQPIEESPSRAGSGWSDDDTIQLLKFIQKGYTNTVIAKEMGRTPGAIKSRRRFIAAQYHFNNGFQTDQIMRYTGLTEKEVKDAIERRKPAEFMHHLKLKREIEKTTAAPQQE
jgi:hypothetical protein